MVIMWLQMKDTPRNVNVKAISLLQKKQKTKINVITSKVLLLRYRGNQ